MYVTIKKIIGEKTVGLPYPIENQNGDKEVAIISIFADNTIYESIADLTVKEKR